MDLNRISFSPPAKAIPFRRIGDRTKSDAIKYQ
jgi:hypothetical protein